jgi:bifunctional oligoribonuclease and PAP phosphatase NrnA
MREWQSPTDEDWAVVTSLVRAATDISLVCHVSPDGDALGSAIAAALGLRDLGKQARVSFGDDPPIVPAALEFLPGLDLVVPPAEIPGTPELMLVFDVASLERLGLLTDKAAAATALIVIDHHASNTGFGTHHLVDTTAPATAVLAEELLRRLGVKLNAEIAAAIYTGLATDTGSFKYAGTTAATHQLAARLLATGIRHDLISRSLWDTARFGYLKVLAMALDTAQLEPEAAGGLGLVWTVVGCAERERHGVAMDEIEGIIDVVRKTAEAEVALVLKEDEGGTYRASFRSKGGIDLGQVAVSLGGGGHRFAAGFTAGDDVDTTLAQFRAALEHVAAQRV